MNNDDVSDYFNEIAVIGMSCRFPDAGNIHKFWDNLKNGKESVTFFTDQELLGAGVGHNLINDPNYVRAGCVLNDVDMFDASFFDYTRDEAELVDPQQRFFLECAYEAFEDAGYVGKNYDGDVGVFGGTKTSGYANVIRSVHDFPGTVKSFQAILGTTVDQACMRISYALSLKGPSIGIQTACSASIVAIHLACESLKNAECSMALAGASGITIPQKKGYLYDSEMITSPDGHCRAYDANAKGTVGGNGVGIVLLKKLDDALSDGDNIYAIIKGSAVNNDGASKIGYRAPSVEGQKRVIDEALMISDVDPDSISYIEGHGTGTFLGDSIEIEALTHVFRKQTNREHYCGLGSVKTNIGHLTQAAGIASFIKTVLALKHKHLPPSLNYEKPNPQLKDSPFFVVDNSVAWETENLPRRAGVNSFAIGGTNAHIILEESPVKAPVAYEKTNYGKYGLLTLSAKTEQALKTIIDNYIVFLNSCADLNIQDICFTSNIGREHHPYRLSVVSDSLTDIRVQLKEKLIKGNFSNQSRKSDTDDFRFHFLDLDCRTNDMNAFYLKTQPSYKEAIEACAGILEKKYGNYVLADFLENHIFDKDVNKKSTVINFVFEYAVYKMWCSWGIRPQFVSGSGSGELTAACAAGMFNMDDCLFILSEIDSDKSNKKEYIENVFNHIDFSEPTIEINSKDRDHLLTKEYWINKILSIDTPHESHPYSFDNAIFIGPYETHERTMSYINSFRGDQAEWFYVLRHLGELYESGYDFNWHSFFKGSEYRRVSLPTYPFQRTSCWFH